MFDSFNFVWYRENVQRVRLHVDLDLTEQAQGTENKNDDVYFERETLHFHV